MSALVGAIIRNQNPAKPRYGTTTLGFMEVCGTENSILHSISIYRHPGYTIRNCGELTVTLLSGFGSI